MNIRQFIPNPNYVLCIMWREANGTVHRYALWKGIGEIFNFDCPLYAGQKIGENFRFEIWNTQGASNSALVVSNCDVPAANGNYSLISPGIYYQQGGIYSIQSMVISSIDNLIIWYLLNTQSSPSPTNQIASSLSSNISGGWQNDVVGGNFTITIILNTPTVQSTPITLYTSVLGKQDYRWATDFNLVASDPENIAFQSSLDLPLVFPATSIPTEN